MFKKLFYGKSKSVTGAALIVAGASLLSRLIGILRDRVLAGHFGAGEILDIYYASFRIPDFIYNLIILGAIAAGFIPIFTSLLREKKGSESDKSDLKPAWDLTNNVINVFSLLIIVLSIFAFIFTKPLVHLIAPGFSSIQNDSMILMTRIMFLSPFFLGLSGIVGGVLQSFKRFFIFSLAPIMYNLGIIFGALFLVKPFGVLGLAWGVALGAFLHFAVQTPVLFSLGYRYRLFINWRDNKLWEIFRMMLPRILGLATTQLNLIVITIFGSYISSGSITIFNLANNLQSLPIGLIGVSLAIAAFPTLSQLYNEKQYLQFQQTFFKSVRLLLFLIIPVSVLFIALRTEIVQVILQVGKFNVNDSHLTALALGIFSASLLAQALIPLLARTFFARHNTWTPFFAGLGGDLCAIFFCWLFAARFGVAGLCLAFSLGAGINFIILSILLSKSLRGFSEAKIWGAFWRAILASGIMALLIFIFRSSLAFIFNQATFWSNLINLSLLAILGVAIYLGCQLLFKSAELEYFRSRFSKKE